MERKYSAEEVEHLLGRAINIEASEVEQPTLLTKNQVYEIAREVGLDEKYVDQVLNPKTSPTQNDLEAKVDEISENENGKRKLIKEINSLLRKAFSRRIPLLWSIKGNVDAGFVGKGYYQSSEIYLSWIYHQNFGHFGRDVGMFAKEDGSQLKVSNYRDLKKAKKYAELYREKFGKDVQIDFDPDHRSPVNCLRIFYGRLPLS